MDSHIPSEEISQYTKQIASVIFNKGSEYITQVLGDAETPQSFNLEDIIISTEAYENNFLQELNTSTTVGNGETINLNNQKLWISWYYQIAILDSICENIQSFSTTLIDQKNLFLNDSKTMAAIENISYSAGPASTGHPELYREILDVNITGTENSYSTYSYKLYIKALINYAISISVKERIPVNRIKEYIEQYSPQKKNYILPNIQNSYEKLVKSEDFNKYIKIIEESIVEGLKTSDMFTETPSTVEGEPEGEGEEEPEGEEGEEGADDYAPLKLLDEAAAILKEKLEAEAAERLKEEEARKEEEEARKEAEEARKEAEEARKVAEEVQRLKEEAQRLKEAEEQRLEEAEEQRLEVQRLAKAAEAKAIAEAAAIAKVAETQRLEAEAAAIAEAAKAEAAAAKAAAAIAEAAKAKEAEQKAAKAKEAEQKAAKIAAKAAKEAEAAKAAAVNAEAEAKAAAEAAEAAEAKAATEAEATKAKLEAKLEAEARLEAEVEAAKLQDIASDENVAAIKKTLLDTYSKYKALFHQINFLKLMTIVSYPDVYKDFIKNATVLKLKSADFLDYLFIDITKLMEIEGYNARFKIQEDNNVISNYSNRDTIIYNLHNPDNKKTSLIFVYMLSKILANSIDQAASVYETPLYVQSIAFYSDLLSKNYVYINNAYNTLLRSKIGTIDVEYNKIVEQYNKIYSFVRIGQRTINLNPRYKYSKFVNYRPAFLELDYINTDKKNDEIKSDVASSQEKYIFGMYDGIYNPGLNNESISDDFFNRCLWNEQGKILKNNICVIGIGQSGSGKTSSLISFNNKDEHKIEPGILIEALNNRKFKGTYKTITLTITEIILDPMKKPENIDAVISKFYKIKDACEPTKYKIGSAGNWELETRVKSEDVSDEEKNALKDIGEYIVWVMDNKRLIHPTPNNPVSSRSHMVICLNCIPDEPKEAKNIIFLDLAGNENEFECNKPAVIVKFYEKYMKEKDLTKLKQVFENKDVKLHEYCSKDKIATIKESETTIVGSNDKIYTLNTTASTMEEYIKELEGALDKLADLPAKINSIEEIMNFLNQTKVHLYTKKGPGTFIEYFLGTGLIYIPLNIFRLIKDETDETIKKGKKDKKDKQDKQDIPYTYDGDTCVKALNYIIDLDKLWNDYQEKKTILKITKTELNSSGKSVLRTRIIKAKDFPQILTSSSHYRDIPDVNSNPPTNKNNYLSEQATKTGIDIFKVLMKQILIEINALLTTESSLTYELVVKPDDTFGDIKKEIIAKIAQRTAEIDCDMPKLLAIAEECKKRRYEGFMINRSIRDMIKEIKSLMRVKLIREDNKISYMPLCFETQIYENCLDPLKDQKIYDTFYDTPETNTETNSSIILQTIRDKTVDLLNLDFIVFTIINVSDTTNNPPDPPFVNINDLIKYTHIIKNDKEMERAFNIVLEKLQKYNFYYPESRKTYIDQILKIKAKPTGKENALIEFINNVNQTTLIGTLESSDKLKHYIFNDIPCLITENTGTSTPQAGGKHQFIEDSNHMTDQNRHVSTRKKQSTGSKRTRKSNKDYRYS